MVYLILKEHNAICWRLKRFNDFWKYHLQYKFIFFLITIWYFVYECFFDIKLALLGRLTLSVFMSAFIVILGLNIYMIFKISQEISSTLLEGDKDNKFILNLGEITLSTFEQHLCPTQVFIKTKLN